MNSTDSIFRTRRHVFVGGFFRAGLFAASGGLMVAASLLASDPYVPSSDDEVLVVLPKSLLDNRDELQRLREQLEANPSNPETAALVAGRYIGIGKREGDPRFFGYARSAIQPWWDADDAPAEMLRLRAELKEQDHQYDAALLDLERARKLDPENTTTLIELVNIFRVQGKYPQALEVGEKLRAIAGPAPADMVIAPIEALTGKADIAYEKLSQLLPAAEQAWPEALPFVNAMRANVAEAMGKTDEVESHYRDSLAASPADLALLRGFGDFLIDEDRPDEALELLRDHTSDNGILLAAAIAARQSGNGKLADDLTQQLAERFGEIRLRGSQPHGRFESRYWRELKDDAPQALRVALENWQRQKEIPDTRALLEAAIAAKNPTAAQPAIDFLKRFKTQHVVIERLVQQLQEMN